MARCRYLHPLLGCLLLIGVVGPISAGESDVALTDALLWDSLQFAVDADESPEVPLWQADRPTPDFALHKSENAVGAVAKLRCSSHAHSGSRFEFDLMARRTSGILGFPEQTDGLRELLPLMAPLTL